jgi:hypothetical protein
VRGYEVGFITCEEGSGSHSVWVRVRHGPHR